MRSRTIAALICGPVLGAVFSALGQSLFVPSLVAQSQPVQGWTLPQGTTVKDNGPRSYQFTVEVIGSTTEPEKAVAELAADPPDVCFLDIQMPRLNGFEVLARLPIQPIVIFTTAHDQYALKAFGVNSVDYLLKPVEPESLDRALQKVERLRGSGQLAQSDLPALLKKFTDSLREAKPECPERIASRLGDRLWFLDLARVTHFYSEDKLTYAVSEGKAYCVDYAITELEKKLDPKKFLRIHRSTVVNVDWIKEVASLPGGALNIRLKDGKDTDLTVARDRARDFKARVGF